MSKLWIKALLIFINSTSNKVTFLNIFLGLKYSQEGLKYISEFGTKTSLVSFWLSSHFLNTATCKAYCVRFFYICTHHPLPIPCTSLSMFLIGWEHNSFGSRHPDFRSDIIFALLFQDIYRRICSKNFLDTGWACLGSTWQSYVLSRGVL